ncbi:MAG: hypothetical protein QXX95_06680 [Nitrososphaerales archaeon]
MGYNNVDRLTISVKEALSYVRYRLREKVGIEIKLERLFVNKNIYGAIDDVCVIGEATARLGTGLIDEFKEKIRLIKEKKLNLLKPKIIKVIYTDYATPDAIEYAKKEKIWIIK